MLKQKNTFVGLHSGPKGPENVAHIVNLAYVPDSEKDFVIKYIFEGFAQKARELNILYII